MTLPLILLAAAAAAPAATCSTPVSAADTATSLHKRYPGARVEKVPGAEGEEFDALVLWPKDPTRRLEVAFADDKMAKVSSVLVRDRSRWRIGAIGIGAPLAAVAQANGKAFTLNGFDWDYGGYADLRGGKLSKLPGGCSLSVQFDLPENAKVPNRFEGEAKIASGDPALAKLKPYVGNYAINFPD